MSVNVCLDDIFWTAEYFVTKLGMVTQHHETECLAGKKKFAVFKVKVTARADMINIWLFLLYLLNCWFFGSQTWSGDISSWARVPYEEIGYCIQDQGHSQGSKYWCLSRWYLLNCQMFDYQTWFCDASSWTGMSWKKIDLLFSRSRSQGFMIELWQFLVHLLNCWSLCHQTWFDSTLS